MFLRYLLLQLFCSYSVSLHVMLLQLVNFLYLNTSSFRSMCAVTNMDIVCRCLILFFFGMFMHFLNNFEMVSSCPSCHFCFSILRALYFYCMLSIF